MNIVRFEMNVPAEVVLESPEGVVVEGRYGNRVMFHLTDGRVMYVPPIVASQIAAQEIPAGERFQLCKTLVKTGSRRSVEWVVQRIDPEQGPEPPADNWPPPEAPESPLEHDLRVSVEMAHANNGKTESPSEVTAVESDAVPRLVAVSNGQANPNGHVNGNGHVPTPQVNAQRPVVTKLEHALKTAISAAYNAEKYGSELGYVVRFDSDAIKSMAITVLINMSEGGRR